MKRASMTPLGSALLAVVILVSGCSGSGKAASTASGASRGQQQVATLRALPMGDAQVAVVQDVLTGSGVGIYAETAEVPEGKPVRLMQWQVRNLAIEAANGGGIAGKDLDAFAPAPAGAPPIQFLVAAWVKTYGSSGARFSRELMGERDWSRSNDILFPQVVLALFLADALGDAHPTQSMSLKAYVDGGPCTFAANFIQNAIGAVANALKVKTDGGGFLGFLGTIWNVAVQIASTVVKGLITAATKPIVDAIADIFGIVATIQQVSSFLVAWRVDLKANPSHTYFGVDSNVVNGQFNLTITQNQLPIPDVVVDCAEAAGVHLRDAGSAAGSTVTWTDGPSKLAKRTSAQDKLSQDKTARLDYQTSQEDGEIAKSPDTETEAYVVTASVQRNDVEKAQELFTKLLLEQVPMNVLGVNLRAVVQGLIQGFLDNAKRHLASITAVNASTRTFVTYHVRQATPTPNSGNGNGAGIGITAVMPKTCPDPLTILKGFPAIPNTGPWEFDGSILPDKVVPAGGLTCGYSRWYGPKDPVSGFQAVEQVGLMISPDVEPVPNGANIVTIPGAQTAYFQGPLYVIASGKTMVVEITIHADGDATGTAIKVAEEVLGVATA